MSSKSDVIKAGLKGLKAAGITAGTASKIAKAVASSKVKAVTKKAKPKKSPPSPISIFSKLPFFQFSLVTNLKNPFVFNGMLAVGAY